MSSILIIFTHYTGYYFLFAEGLIILFILIKQKFSKRNTLKAFFVLVMAGCIGFILLSLMSRNPAFTKSIKLLEIGGHFKLTKDPLGEIYLALSRIKEVISFYYWFGLYYFSVDPIIQFIFKKSILVLLFLGAYFMYRERKTKEATIVAAGSFILFVSLTLAYIGEKLGYFPFGGRHVMPYTVFLYPIIAYAISKLKLYGLILFVLLIALFISFQFCYTYGILPSEVFLTIPSEIYKTCYTRLF
jgi:TctA family transporter